MDNQVTINFPDLLVDYIKKSGIKKNHLAKQLGLGKTAISDLCAGRQNPTSDALFKLVSIFSKKGLMTCQKRLVFLQAAFIARLTHQNLSILQEIEKKRPYFSIRPPKLSPFAKQKAKQLLPQVDIRKIEKMWFEKWQLEGFEFIKNPDFEFLNFVNLVAFISKKMTVSF